MKAAITLINLIIAVLFFSVIYSAANVDVSIKVDANSPGAIALEGANLKMAVPVKIENRGLYPIKNVRIGFNITNSSTVIYGDEFHIKEIGALDEYSGVFEVKINLTDFYRKLGDYYLFHSGKFILSIDVRAEYWILADFEANYSRVIEWKPLLYACRVYTDEIRIDDGKIIVPYFVSKQPIPVKASINLVVRDRWGVLARGGGEVVFDRKTYLSMPILRNLDYLMVKSDEWSIILELNVNGMHFEKTYSYHWNPPISGLSLMEDVENGTPALYLVFKSSYPKDLSVRIEKTIIHDGEKISGVENLTVHRGQIVKVYLMNVEPGSYHVEITIVIEDLGMRKTISYDMEV